MDRVISTEDIEREIEATMRERGISRAEAMYAVGLKFGELHGDLLSLRPLTDEQRRQLTQPLHETMLELGEIDEETLFALRLPGQNGHRDRTSS
jgi:hypothetical protein